MRETFPFDQGGSFGVTASKIPRCDSDGISLSSDCELTCSVHLLGGFKVDIVKCSRKGFAEKKTMSKIFADDKEELKLFREKFGLLHQSYKHSYNFNVHLIVYLKETNERWGYRIHDPFLPSQLWSASKEKIFTDVELRVGNQTFHAHRAILSARSPVFAAMFGSDMKESRTGVVEIKDIKADTFEIFLEFLYTGRLKTTENLEELWTPANMYNVKTLEIIS